MKKFLKQLFRFSLFVGIFLIALNIFQYNYNGDAPIHTLHYKEIQHKSTDTDAIIIGTSHVTHAIRPSLLEETNYSFFNFSLSAAGPVFYLDWYTELFSKTYPKPKVCIYAVDWFTFYDNWKGRDFEQDSEYFSSDLFWKLVISNKFNTKKLILNKIPIIKYRSQIISSLKLYKGNTKYFLLNEYDRGFIPFPIPKSFNPKSYKLEKKQADLIISNEKKQAFIALVERLKSDRIKLIFVMAPEYNLDDYVYTTPVALFLEEAAKKHNIPFLNFNTDLRSEMNIDINNFSDWIHLTSKGSIKFSKILNDELIKLNI